MNSTLILLINEVKRRHSNTRLLDVLVLPIKSGCYQLRYIIHDTDIETKKDTKTKLEQVNK